MNYFKLFFSALFCLVLFSCGGNDSPTENAKVDDGFDRKEMLRHWADNFIIPYTEKFKDEATNLDTKIKVFVQEPNQTHLTEVREALNKTYEAYQYIGFYRLGKAEEVSMNFLYRVNTYPTNTERIKQNAKDHNYNFRQLSEIQGGKIAQGLPAIDYLVNGLEPEDNAILMEYTSGQEAAAYKAYLSALSAEILKSATEVLADWKGGYRNKFVENTDSNASGSISLMVNAYVQYYEKNLRAAKIGYPSGVLTPMFLAQSEAPKPHLIESQFAPQYSRAYALLGTKAMLEFFQGKGINGKSGKSLQHYIDYMATKNAHHKTLSQDIVRQFEEAIKNIEALNPNLKIQITQDLAQMKNAYFSLQQNVSKLKVDMVQSLNITISYMDTDGD
ncbi:imelysin family protein [Riemerella anatipestifer]|uniref:imelysin family protein n=1 Tax=Riemerella anatipestifer TaxID=34085 RepID=UPI0021D61163|nr:imelysin family protein [Riemerella anatipestifer]MCU7542172.1 imelysin family protein [Riemerella anatipestifer]MCW0512933.1 imelysin family protein [Riemerella anatipestifer]